MLTIKKYANGRMYDTVNKTYLTREALAAMLKEKTKLKVIVSKTGKDITKKMTAELAPADKPKAKVRKRGKLPVAALKKWMGKQMDKGVDKLLGIMNLARKDQVAQLADEMRRLSAKFDELQKKQERGTAQSEKAHGETSAHISGKVAAVA